MMQNLITNWICNFVVKRPMNYLQKKQDKKMHAIAICIILFVLFFAFCSVAWR